MFRKIIRENRHFLGSYHIYIYIYVFLNPLQIFLPCVEIISFINIYALLCIFKYRKSLHKFHRHFNFSSRL